MQPLSRAYFLKAGLARLGILPFVPFVKEPIIDGPLIIYRLGGRTR